MVRGIVTAGARKEKNVCGSREKLRARSGPVQNADHLNPEQPVKRQLLTEPGRCAIFRTGCCFFRIRTGFCFGVDPPRVLLRPRPFRAHDP